MEASTDRLSLAPDAHSGTDGASNCKWSDPAPPAGNRDQGGVVAGRPGEVRPGHRQPHVGKVSDMAKRTRGPGHSDSGTSVSATKITPVASSGSAVTSTKDLR